MSSTLVSPLRALGASGLRIPFPRRTRMWAKYRNFDEFEREEIRPGLRAGWSLDNINDPSSVELDFDEDPFERALLESEQDEEEEGDFEESDYGGNFAGEADG